MSSRRPRHAAAAEQVQVDVKHRLTRVAVGVEYRPEPAGGEPTLLGDGRRAAHQLADDLIVFGADLVQRGDVPLGNDEHVRRRLRIDVVEGQDARSS